PGLQGNLGDKLGGQVIIEIAGLHTFKALRRSIAVL
ncbi:unnamed protein product, partial [marine sediment metagenome]